MFCFFFSFSWFLNVLVSNRLSRGRVSRLTSDNFKCYHTDKDPGNHYFWLNRQPVTNTDTDRTSRERAHGVGIEPTTSWSVEKRFGYNYLTVIFFKWLWSRNSSYHLYPRFGRSPIAFATVKVMILNSFATFGY